MANPWAEMAKFAPIIESEIEKCDYCKEWEKTGRPCTLPVYGECDCPLCQGMCVCEENFLDEDPE